MSEESMQAFGRACAEQNSAGEILDGLEVSADGEFFYTLDEASLADCIDWDLTPLEWVRGLNLALLYQARGAGPDLGRGRGHGPGPEGVGNRGRDEGGQERILPLQRAAGSPGDRAG